MRLLLLLASVLGPNWLDHFQFQCSCCRHLLHRLAASMFVDVYLLPLFYATIYSYDDIFYRSCLSGHSGHLSTLFLWLSIYLIVVPYLTTSVWIPGLGFLVWLILLH